MNRSKLRENIFKLLFIGEFNPLEEMTEQVSLYFNDLGELSPKDRAYMEEKYKKVTEKLPEIDEQLNEASNGWKTTRMSKVDLTILRLAAYELLYDEDVPTGVAINEAVEIGKQFGGDESASFINGILGRLAEKKVNNRGTYLFRRTGEPVCKADVSAGFFSEPDSGAGRSQQL